MCKFFRLLFDFLFLLLFWKKRVAQIGRIIGRRTNCACELYNNLVNVMENWFDTKRVCKSISNCYQSNITTRFVTETRWSARFLNNKKISVENCVRVRLRLNLKWQKICNFSGFYFRRRRTSKKLPLCFVSKLNEFLWWVRE